MNRRCQPLFIVLLLALTACIPPRVDNRGHVDAFNRMDDVVIGVTTREDVFKMLGSPSVTNSFGDEIWYYIAKRKEAVAFLKPEIMDQQVTRIAFDTEGTVISVNDFDMDDKKDIIAAKEITPTEGHELGFVEQVVGNVGRFNGDNARRPNLGRR